jgi:uncharacterized membrane protein
VVPFAARFVESRLPAYHFHADAEIFERLDLAMDTLCAGIMFTFRDMSGS